MQSGGSGRRVLECPKRRFCQRCFRYKSSIDVTEAQAGEPSVAEKCLEKRGRSACDGTQEKLLDPLPNTEIKPARDA
jgi:hypothetical protein